MNYRPSLAVVGGFLGAGKTTLILAAGRELTRRGLKPAFILNDQGGSLVDTQHARQSGFEADEVTGGCFCCNFGALIEAADNLRAYQPDVIFAEPVGSCTDIAATVLRPLRELYTARFRLLPFTVCVDPKRALEIKAPDASPHLAFLFDNQVAEADLLCYTKADLYPGITPSAPVSLPSRFVSSQTGQGVSAWLDEILQSSLTPGEHCLEIDYDQYARAEAALVWLNLHALVECHPPMSPALLLGPLVDRIAASVDVVHLKATDHSDTGFLKAAICGTPGKAGSAEEPQIEGSLDASPASSHELLVNLRAGGRPDDVRAVVEESMAELSCRILHQHISCFTPAAPKRPGRAQTKA